MKWSGNRFVIYFRDARIYLLLRLMC